MVFNFDTFIDLLALDLVEFAAGTLRDIRDSHAAFFSVVIQRIFGTSELVPILLYTYPATQKFNPPATFNLVLTIALTP